MNYLAVDVWAVFPYVVMLLFFGVPVFRYKTNRFSIHSPSTELLEKRVQEPFSYLWHYGIILVFLGHVLGLLVPVWLMNELGIPFEIHRLLAVYIGGTSGLAALAGLLGLTYRRFTNKRVRATMSWDYYVVYALLIAVLVAGLFNTLGYQLFIRPYNYDATIGTWLQGVLTLRPDPVLMVEAPISFQIHVFLAMLFLAVFPFTFLIHMWTGIFNSISYIFRPRIVYRSRAQPRFHPGSNKS